MRILVLVLVLLMIASASGDFSVYLQDDGPSSDVVLATQIVLAAQRDVELPATGYSKLFSEYETDDDVMLIIADGDVWIVDPAQRDEDIVDALENAVRDANVDPEFTTLTPRFLTDPESVCSEEDEYVEYCADGSIEASCECVRGSLECIEQSCRSAQASVEVTASSAERNTTPEETSPIIDSEAVPEEPEPTTGWWTPIIERLFGWFVS